MPSIRDALYIAAIMLALGLIVVGAMKDRPTPAKMACHMEGSPDLYAKCLADPDIQRQPKRYP